MPHEIRLDADSGTWAIRISSDRSLATGTNVLSRQSAERLVGHVIEDVPMGSVEGEADHGWRVQHVRGAIEGTLEVSRNGDSTFVTITGQSVLRDTVPLRAHCRMRTIDTGK